MEPQMKVSLQDSTKVLIDYYDGAYGPTLRIDVQTEERLGQFRELLFSVAERAERQTRLHEMPWVSSRPDTKITVLMVNGTNQTERPSLKVQAHVPNVI